MVQEIPDGVQELLGLVREFLDRIRELSGLGREIPDLVCFGGW